MPQEKDSNLNPIFWVRGQRKVSQSSFSSRNRSHEIPENIKNFQKPPVISQDMSHHPIMSFQKVAFPTFFSPYKIKHDKNGSFRLQKWLPQQLLCLVGVLTSLYVRTNEVIHHLPQLKSKWNPVRCFELFHRISNLLFNINVWILIWLRFRKLLEILEFVQGKQIRSKKPVGILVTVFGIVNVVIVSIAFIHGLDEFGDYRWQPKRLLQCLGHHATNFNFHFRSCKSNSTDGFRLDSMSPLDVTITTIYIFCRYLRKTLGLTEELLVLVGPLTLWMAVKEFLSLLENTDRNNLPWQRILAKYRDLCQFADLVNETFGPLILSYVVVALFYFSMHLDDVLALSLGSANGKYTFVVYYALILATFVVAAEIPRQVIRP